MKKRTMSLLAVIGLTLGSFAAAGAASAQGYGGEAETTTGTESVETESTNGVTGVQVQDTVPGTEDEESEDQGRRGRGHRGGCNLEAAAAAIGIDEADLRAAIDDGQTIGEVAEANGVDVDAVIDAMVDAKAERLAEKVESGRLTQAEADEKLADVEERITDRVNGVDGDDQTDA